MCPGLLCCALRVRLTLQHRLNTELSTPKTLQHLKPHPLVLPFTCGKPGKGVSAFPPANLCVGGWHSLEPAVFSGAPTVPSMKMYMSQVILWAGQEH